MAIEPGSRIGFYEVTSQLGEGGMGVVFRARDTKLQRDVAIKVLPEQFAQDRDRLSRFQREAQLLASLNHPNIAQIYGLEEVDGAGCIVMELVEGETLAERLKRGPIPMDEAADIARQLAEALAAAHERGIVHRDLKPANIKVAPNGTVKVLDFGLAKALGTTASDPGLSTLPTSVSASIAGAVVGTVGYMSPEQARGKEVDARTDIWAFGCVFYEMLTARHAFEGETATDIMARIVTGAPDLSLLPPETPLSVRMLLAATLNKNPQQRLQHIGDMRLFLNQTLTPPPPTTAPAERARSRSSILAAALAVALALALIPAVLYFKRSEAMPARMRFEISMPDLVSNAVVLSPDGRRMVYLVQPQDGPRTLWVRPIDGENAQKIPGAENVNAIFWSGDSRYVGFVADGKLMKVDPSGGVPQVIADAQGARSFNWSRQGVILFSTTKNIIARISDAGGEIQPVTSLDASRKEMAQGAPVFLPDGNHFLYLAASAQPDASGIFAASLDGKGAPVRVMSVNVQRMSGFGYAAPGYILFVAEGRLTAQRFDADKLKLDGEPVTLAENVDGGFTASDDGLLMFRKAAAAGANNKQLAWFDRDGKQLAEIGAPANYGGIELSPDGDRVATDITSNNNRDIWVVDLMRAVPLRITFDPAPDWTPSWSPDASRLAFASAGRANQPQQIYQKASSGVGMDELISTDGQPAIPTQWSPDNKYILFSQAQGGGRTGNDTWMLPLFGDRKPKPFLQTPFDKIQARISPDARWIAYATSESGTFQIVVQSFPDPNGGKWQISADGGVEPRWRRDGRELYYLALDGKIMAVPVKPGDRFEAGRPAPLFQTALTVNRSRPDRDRRYDVTRDGQRFLIVAPVGRGNSASVTLLVNWPSAFTAR